MFQGFEPRGTEIGERMVAYRNLMDNIGENANLLPFRHNKKSTLIDRIKERTKNGNRKKKKKNRKKDKSKAMEYIYENITFSSDSKEQFFCSIPCELLCVFCFF